MKTEDLSPEQINVIYGLVESLIGSCQDEKSRKEVLLDNIVRCIAESGSKSVEDYLQKVLESPREFAKFISAGTIHTTNWFRERPHYNFLGDIALKFANQNKSHTGQVKSPFRFWSAACSTGEEAYSAAITLSLALVGKGVTFEVYGTDIDPVSVGNASRAIFSTETENEQVTNEEKSFFLQGHGPLKGKRTLAKEIRERCRFEVMNLCEPSPSDSNDQFDVIFLRNVLIYFEASKQESIVKKILRRLKPGGYLVLGHCDRAIRIPGLRLLENAIYRKDEKALADVISIDRPPPKRNQMKKILVVDDSAVIRKGLAKILGFRFDIVEASSAEVAERAIQEQAFDLISLDLNMPGENGVSWLRRFRQRGFKTPVVIVSDSNPNEAEKIFGALQGGAQEYIRKIELSTNEDRILEIAEGLTSEKSAVSLAQGLIKPFPASLVKGAPPEAIVLGASTGGPDALCRLLSNLPPAFPPIVIVQHISAEFAKAFGNRVAKSANGNYFGGKVKTLLVPGTVYHAEGDFHYQLSRTGSQIWVEGVDAPKVNGHRPSVDVLFNSAAEIKLNGLAVLLTGMGSDGAVGLKKIHLQGNTATFAQDEESSVVFGMPKAAIQAEAVHFVGNIAALRGELEKFLPVNRSSHVA